MSLEDPPSLPHAHQQIRLGDIQASAHKWSTAIDYYLCAIEHFQAVKKTLHDDNLILVIQAQIKQCEKTINLCRLKDRSEQAVKAQQAERLSKMPRAYSTSNLKSPSKPNRMMSRHNTIQLENSVMLGGHDGMDSLAAFIFPKNNQSSPTRKGPIAKKNQKIDSHKIEELQTSNEALKTHLKAAMDDIERLKSEINLLHLKQEENLTEEENETRFLSASEDEGEEQEDPETELEATI